MVIMEIQRSNGLMTVFYHKAIQVIKWQGEIRSIVIYDDIQSVEKIHGHQGSSRIVYVDETGESASNL